MPDDRLHELEIKISFLEKHTEGQDRAMMEMSNQLAALERQVKRLAESVKNSAASGPGSSASPADERPPHY